MTKSYITNVLVPRISLQLFHKHQKINFAVQRLDRAAVDGAGVLY